MRSWPCAASFKCFEHFFGKGPGVTQRFPIIMTVFEKAKNRLVLSQTAELWCKTISSDLHLVISIKPMRKTRVLLKEMTQISASDPHPDMYDLPRARQMWSKTS